MAVGHGDKAAVVLMAPLMPQAGKAGCRSKLFTSLPLASGAVCSWRSSLPSNKMEQAIHPDIIVTSLSVRVLFYFYFLFFPCMPHSSKPVPGEQVPNK